MAVSKDGKRTANKFQANRRDKEQGVRAEANEEKGTPTAARDAELTEAVAPNVASEHGPAREVHIMHDHVANVHHVHTMHDDGYEDHSDHPDAVTAHMHGAVAAGAPSNEGNYPEENEPPHKKKAETPEAEPVDDDDYDVEPLD